MRKCSGNNFNEWGFDSTFEIDCPQCGNSVEFFKDEITRRCPDRKSTIKNGSKYYGCGQWSSSSSAHQRNLCPSFKKTKDRFIGSTVF